MITKFQEVKTESHSEGPNLEAKVHIEDSEINSKTKEPILEKYIRRHHAPIQIIGDKSDGTMTRSKLKLNVYLLNLNLEMLKML